MQDDSRRYEIGEIYMMRFDGSKNEQSGWRPGLVFQNNVGNQFSPNIIALPLTSSIKKTAQPTHVIVRASDTGLRLDSMVLCENPERISKDRVGKYITKLPEKYMTEIAAASLVATSAVAYLNLEALLKAWEKSKEINKIR